MWHVSACMVIVTGVFLCVMQTPFLFFWLSVPCTVQLWQWLVKCGVLCGVWVMQHMLDRIGACYMNLWSTDWAFLQQCQASYCQLGYNHEENTSSLEPWTLENPLAWGFTMLYLLHLRGHHLCGANFWYISLSSSMLYFVSVMTFKKL